MRRRIAPIQFDRALEFLLRAGPVPLAEFCKGERRVSFPERVVKLQGLGCGQLYLGRDLSRRKHVEVAQQGVRIRLPGIGQRVLRVFLNSLLEEIDALLYTLQG